MLEKLYSRKTPKDARVCATRGAWAVVRDFVVICGGMTVRLGVMSKGKRTVVAVMAAGLAMVVLSARAASCSAQGGSTEAGASWKFAVSGDSRNCGDVVMPAIAAGVAKSGAAFYWHLGDFRKITEVDEDIAHQPEHLRRRLSMPGYEKLAWKDFIANQLQPFGSMRVYLARGNHETAFGRTNVAYLARFAPWLDRPNLRAQRLMDDPSDLKPHIYYHWTENGVDFITLDNAKEDEFDAAQLAWFEKTLGADSADGSIRTVVVGMHEALPESISKGHSMNQSERGVESGLRAYAALLKVQEEGHKQVYVLASHSHYFMDGIFNTDYWRQHGGVLPGWIVGTAGAVRYPLPPESPAARAAQTNVYGFLIGTVNADGRIQFDFQRVNEPDVPGDVTQRYTAAFVHWCFAQNSEALK
jgi:Calcineurin-like phosphoesterase